ncbi:MAG: cysteine rich repeat-containing protein [Pseudomonadota bacterium]
MFRKTFEKARVALIVSAITLPAMMMGSSPALAELMAACEPEINSLCNGVREGRGRISACLFAHSNKISPACSPELAKVTSSRMFQRHIPQGVHSLNDTAYEASLRKICAPDIANHCSNVKPGDDRLLACLYAWNNKVSSACQSEAKVALDHLK